MSVTDDPLLNGERYDYADAFAVAPDPSDSRPAEQWMRDALESSPRALRWLIVVVHTHVLRFQLEPQADRNCILGWRVTASAPDAVRIDAAGPLIEATLVGRKVDPKTVEIRSFVRYVRRPLAPRVWAVIGPIHRRVAPYLLRRSRDAAAQ